MQRITSYPKISQISISEIPDDKGTFGFIALKTSPSDIHIVRYAMENGVKKGSCTLDVTVSCAETSRNRDYIEYIETAMDIGRRIMELKNNIEDIV
jgi:uncharacterized protein YdaL